MSSGITQPLARIPATAQVAIPAANVKRLMALIDKSSSMQPDCQASTLVHRYLADYDTVRHTSKIVLLPPNKMDQFNSQPPATNVHVNRY